LKPFFENYSGMTSRYNKVVEFAHQIIYIQKKIRSFHRYKWAKVDVLMNYWDKMLG